MLQRALPYSHTLLKEVIESGDCVVDATMGNGHDTLFLSSLVGEHGKVYAFDVQQKAIDNTSRRLEEVGADNYELFLTGHENIAEVLDEETHISAAIFNLGYLPNSDKTIITNSKNTIAALEQLMGMLQIGGRIVLVVYYGHKGGEDEKRELISFCQNISQEEYNVLQYNFINQVNSPPLLLCIEKKGS